MDLSKLEEIYTTDSADDKKERERLMRRSCVGCGGAHGRPDLTTGGLKRATAKIYKVKVPFQIFRLYKNDKYEPGPWWLFKKPPDDQSIDDFRKQYNICGSWSPLAKLSEATLRKNAIIVVGEGAAATCDGDDENYTYPESSILQIFVPKLQRELIDNQHHIADRGQNTKTNMLRKPPPSDPQRTFSWTKLTQKVPLINHTRPKSAPPGTRTQS